MGRRLESVDAAAPPRVVNSWWLLLLLCTDDDEVEPSAANEGEDGKFQGSRGDDRKMPRPLDDDDDDCTALTTLSVIEITANRQIPSAVAV